MSFPARIKRALFYRARSASKKDGLAVPLLFFTDRAWREHRGLTRPSLSLLALDLRRLVMERGDLRANEIGKVLVAQLDRADIGPCFKHNGLILC